MRFRFTISFQGLVHGSRTRKTGINQAGGHADTYEAAEAMMNQRIAEEKEYRNGVVILSREIVDTCETTEGDRG
jgi:hypothetical protein